MTETRTASDRRSAVPGRGSTAPGERPDRAAAGSWPVRERSLVGPVLGIPPVVAVGLAVGLTAIGVVVDLLRVGTVATIFEIAYGAGCLLAVAWVRRRSIFLPAIQPPLLLAVVVPALAVLVGAPSSTAGVTEHLLLAGAPLINAFPAMAVTTGLVLLLAGYRLLRQRTGPDDAVGVLRARLSGRGAARSGGDDAVGARGGRDAGRSGAGRPADDRVADRAGRRTDRATDRAKDRAGDRAAGAADRATDRAKDRPSTTRRSARGEPGTGRGRSASSRTRTDGRDDTPGRGGRPTGSRDRARPDDSPPDAAGRRAPRGSGRGGARGGSSSDERTRSRRPRPSDPS